MRIGERFSVRWFKQDPLPLNVVYKLVEATTRAPTAHGGEQHYARRALQEPTSSEVVERWLKRINEEMYWASIYIVAYIDLRGSEIY